MAKFTEGPWVVSNRHVGVTLDDFPDQSPQFDSVECPDMNTGGGIALVHRKPGMGNPNAALIASAPELLKALEALYNMIYEANQPLGIEVKEMVETAIKKATGG